MAVNPLVQVLSHSLDALSLRQQVIAQNLSNMTTVGYQPLQVNFEEALQDQLSRSGLIDPAQISEAQVQMRPYPNDKVVMDQEVALLSQTVLQYQALVRGLNKQISIMQLAVTEGKR